LSNLLNFNHLISLTCIKVQLNYHLKSIDFADTRKMGKKTIQGG